MVSPMFRPQQGRGVDSGAVTLCLLLYLPPAACGLRQTAQSVCYHMVVITYICVNTFAASYLNTQGLNNSYLKSPASTLVDITFQSRALRSFSLNQLRNLSL